MLWLHDIHDRSPRVVLWLALVSAPLLGGCMKPNPLIYEHDDEASEAGTGDTGAETGGAGFPDLPEGEGNGCAPVEGFEPACGACLAQSCCDLALECAALDDCACLAECLTSGGNNGTCKSACGAKAEDIPELDSLLACVTDMCSASC
jgi:hypothetical protein